MLRIYAKCQDTLHTLFPQWLSYKESACNTGSSLGWEDPEKEETAIYSSILAGKIPWKEESGGVQSIGLQRVRHD